MRAHWGRFHQTDEVHELKVEDGLTQFPEAQRSDQAILGIDHRLNNGLAMRLEGFRKLQSDPRPHFENLLDPMSLVPEIAPDRIEVAPLAAEVRGAEITAVSEGHDLSWWLGLAWSEASDSLGGHREPRSWDQTWAVTAGVDWIYGNWRFGAVAGTHRGWPTTRVEDDALDAAQFRPLPDPRDARPAGRVPQAPPRSAASPSRSRSRTPSMKATPVASGSLPRTTARAARPSSTKDSDWLPIVPSVGVLWEF